MSIKLMTAVWDTKIGPATRRLVLLALADIANDDGEAWPSIDTLATRANCSRTTAEDSLRSLVTDGIIERESRGFHRSNMYRINRATLTPGIRGAPKTPGIPDDDPRNPGRETPENPGTEPSVEPPVESLKPSSDAADADADQDRDEDQPRADVEQLCTELRKSMIANGCKPPTVGKRWREAGRLLLDLDKRPLDEALDILAWSQADPFWQTNIHSLPTFRAKYDQLRLRWLQTNPVRHLRSPEAIRHWLHEQWRQGLVRAIEERSGLRFDAPDLPNRPMTADEARAFHADTLRQWITDHHDEIVERIQRREQVAS
jgi:hypothetical protein